MLYNHIDLDATQSFKFSRRPGLRRSSIRLLHQTGRTRRNSFACRVVNNWNCLPFAVASETEQRKFKHLVDSYVYLQIFLVILSSPQYGLFWALCPFPISKYIHTRLRADLILAFTMFKGGVDLSPSDFFFRQPRARLREHTYRLLQGPSRHRRRSGAFPVKRLLVHLVLSPSVSVFKKQLDRQW